MSSSKYYREYHKNQVSTSSQGTLILMMYDGAIKFIRMAIQCIDRNDPAGKGLYLQKSHDVINELSVSLDMQKGGDIAKRLEELYQFVLREITHANLRNDREALESILRVLTPLREAWDEIFNGKVTDIQDPPSPPSAPRITAKG